MDDLMFLQKYETLQNLNGIISNFISGKPNEARGLEMLEQVCMKQFKYEAMVVSEETLVHHSYNIVLVIRIFLHDVFQVLRFLVSKFMVHFGVTSYFYCD